MKKIIFIFLVSAFLVLPGLVSAGFDNQNGAMLLTRLEVSKDGSTWVNYLAETNSGGDTLSVSPGDTIFFRIKTWNTGDTSAVNVEYTASYTNPQYIDAFDPFDAGTNDDSDGQGRVYALSGLPDMNAGTMEFTLEGVLNSSSETTNFESGVIVARIAADAPDQGEVIATVQITQTGLFLALWDKLSPRAYADDQATTRVRMVVSNLPNTSPSVLPPITGK